MPFLIAQQSLKEVAHKTYQLRESLASKKIAASLLDIPRKQNSFREMMTYTAFLNAIVDHDFLHGNFFAEKLKFSLKSS